MKYVTLSNGVKMPRFGLGTFRVEAGESAYQTVLTALELGYRHIDTAQMYHNEADVGSAIKDSGIQRSEIFITTKQKEHYNGDQAKVLADIHESLKLLKTDYIDLLIIHWPNHDPKMNASTWKVLEKVYQEGLVKAIGVSNFPKHHLDALLETAEIVPMVNQVEMHPGLNQEPLRKYLESKNVIMISYGPFMKGRIYEEPYKDDLAAIASKYNISIAQLVIAWGLERGILMIPKSVNRDRLLENFKAEKVKLEKADVKAINALNRGTRVYTDPDNNPFYNN